MEEDIQRAQVLEGMAALVAERGVGAATLADVIVRAGVSRRAFYRLFPDRKSCLVAAFDLGVQRASARMGPAYAAQSRWRDGIRAGLAEGLRFLDDEPAMARLLVVHSLSEYSELVRRRSEVQEQLWKVVDRGRGEGGAGRAEPPPIVAEGVVGAVLTVVQTRLLAQDADPPDERPTIQLFSSLMSLIVLPYLGPSAAQRELARPAPLPSRRGGVPSAPISSFDDHGVRLTYRTERVLSAIAQYPGASNREIAEGAGIADQGQISKLLTRLERLELVRNTGDGQVKGGSNAWHLTDRGAQVERATKPR